MTKHTPTPWRIATDMRGIGNDPVHGVEAADGTPVANCGDWKEARAKLSSRQQHGVIVIYLLVGFVLAVAVLLIMSFCGNYR